MIVEKSKLDKVLVLTPPTVQEDYRGEYIETYNEGLYRDAIAKAGMICPPFVQDDISISYKHVMRGLHGDQKTWKLVSCLFGRIWLVVVNWDPETLQYKHWAAFSLSDKNHLQVLIPPNFANGHLAMSDVAIFSYKQTTYYDRASQFTIRYDDERLNIWWPVTTTILSQRDQAGGD